MCRAPARVLAQRAANRDRLPGRVSDGALPIVMRESQVWDPLDEVAPAAHLTPRSDRPVEAQRDVFVALLDRRLGHFAAPETQSGGSQQTAKHGAASEAWPAS